MGRAQIVAAVIIILIFVSTLGLIFDHDPVLREESAISVDRLEGYMQQQIDLGYRIPGSEGSLAFRDWIVDTVPSSWIIEIQNFTYQGIELRNYFITYSNSDQYPSYLFGAHYDSRARATEDPVNPNLPVPGANDAASGVAAILEMMHQLDKELASKIGFILFDAEDQGSGGMDNFSWIVGSTQFARNMTIDEVAAVEFFLLFDMIADDELIMKWEGFSNTTLNKQIWDKADSLGYGDIFIEEVGPHLIDDHQPFLKRDIVSVDLIDFDYPEWHTTNDDMDHVSAENAAVVLDVTLEWLYDYDGGVYSEENISSSQSITSSTTSQTLINSDNESTSDSANSLLWASILILLPILTRWSNRD